MDTTQQLCALLQQAGLRVYFRRSHPTLERHCIHAVPMAETCALCAAPPSPDPLHPRGPAPRLPSESEVGR